MLAYKLQKPTDKYPYSFNELYREVLKIKPGVKKNWIYDTIKKLDIKNNEEYSIPNFVRKQLEERYKKTGVLPKGTTYIYNRKAIELIISKCN